MPVRSNGWGAVWIIADMSLNIWALSLVKFLGPDYPPWQVVFLRASVGLILLLPLVWRHGIGRVEAPGWQAARVAFSAVALTAGFAAVARLPLALHMVINFTRPLMLMALAAWFLGEVIARRQWLAGGIGLIGAAVAVGPSLGGDALGLLAATIAVIAGTGAVIVTRKLRDTSPLVMMLCYTGGLATLTALPAGLAWVPVPAEHWPLFIGVGLFAQAAQMCFLRGHRLGDAGVLAPLGYLSLILSGAVGFVVFGEVPGLRLILGGAVIVAATLLIRRRRNGVGLR
ncbi:drug/metabolite transporter (DMT)-like permease [Rubricella aquisinus]|uniref:Drug/metabolite transporter (DMT)-like permease n=1 Tax=Rubricella aquisinus TaxID=2028108 RepID=A0A840WN31_9RHOB|nr:DMT family transporter [Rubricella aquisinus]MBB5516478.1 drug/metabolite transporter (DMT)-like permease [Rubricella aquisinus]